MRISSFQLHQQASQQLAVLGSQAAATQDQISNGKRLIVPADDPIGAARLIELKAEIRTREQYLRNADAADNALELEESVLGQVTELLFRVQELTIRAGSGTQTAEDLQFIASEIEIRFEELLGLANARDAGGKFLFGGYEVDKQPFVFDGVDVAYEGDEGIREVSVEDGRTVRANDPGNQVFIDIPSNSAALNFRAGEGDASISNFEVFDQQALDEFFPDDVVITFNDPAAAGGVPNFSVTRASDGRPLEGQVNIPYGNGVTVNAAGTSFRLSGTPVAGEQVVLTTSNTRSVFDTVRAVADGLRDLDPQADPEALSALLDRTVESLNDASNNLSRVRADVGARFSSIAVAQDLHQDVNLQLQSMRSEIEDLDFTEAVSNLAYQSFVLEAAQQSYIRINNLSLFNRL